MSSYSHPLRDSHVRDVGAFTLPEVMIASASVGLIVWACFAAIVCDQVALRKAKEEAIAMDFLVHYVENVKALPFTAIVPGMPINSLFNGANGAPRIVIPTDDSWVSLNTSDFETFDPDLLWVSSRNPQMQVTLTQNIIGGVLHDIELNAKMEWDPPLQKGQRQVLQLDLFRSRDL